MDTRIHATLKDLIEQEITPAITAGEEVGEDFDLDGFVDKLREEELIRYVRFEKAAQRDGYELVKDERGETPGFWEYVQEFDR